MAPAAISQPTRWWWTVRVLAQAVLLEHGQAENCGSKPSPYVAVMCGRTRLSTDYLETRIKLKFDPDYPAPNIPASWNVCPTGPMLVAVRNEDCKRIPRQLRWGLVPWWARRTLRSASLQSMRGRCQSFLLKRTGRSGWAKCRHRMMRRSNLSTHGDMGFPDHFLSNETGVARPARVVFARNQRIAAARSDLRAVVEDGWVYISNKPH
jgi:SOS response associated peptidase (SRAP)